MISVGQDNPYGHPYYKIIEYFRKENLSLYRTDKDGAVIFFTDGENLETVTGGQSPVQGGEIMKQLLQSLKNGIFSPVYLFFGEETYLMEEAVKAVKAHLSPDGNDWNTDIFDGEDITLPEVLGALETGGFFPGKRLVMVKNPPWFKKKSKARNTNEEDGEEAKEGNGASDLQSLLDYLRRPHNDSVLLVTINGNLDKRLKIVQEIKKAGRVIEFPVLTYKDNQLIYDRMRDFLKKRGQRADTDVFAYLTLVAGYNLSFLYRELDKLANFCQGQKEISLEDARQIASRGNLTVVFELSDALLEKDAQKSVAAFRALTKEGEAEQKLLYIIYKQFHDLIMVQELAKRGLTSSEIAKEAGLHPYVAGKYYRMRRNFTPDQALKALELLLSADIANKSGEGDLYNLLELAILRICAFPS